MTSPRSSMDVQERMIQLETELENTKAEKETLGAQYRSLLSKLTGMRQSLGEKLREDAEELDRRENTINTLHAEISELQQHIETLKSELVNVNQESTSLQNQLAQLRSQSDSSSSDVLSLTREMRELRGEMERLRIEREEWEAEASREREKRERMEDEVRAMEKRERDGLRELERARQESTQEKERASNLQDVLSEFQANKDGELRQATAELEAQLKLAAASLSEYKLRAANAETRLTEVGSDKTRSSALEKELKEKTQIIGKLRHDAVVNNEHLTEALRRLRKNTSDTNVDRRLVTNILLSFLTAPRSDSKRFEMLSILATILSWDDTEREKAGLQRIDKGAPRAKVEKGKARQGEKSAEDAAALNESFSNLFVEFLLKEASQGQRHSPTLPGGPETPGSPNERLSSPPWSPAIAGTPPRAVRRSSSASNTSVPPSILGELSNTSGSTYETLMSSNTTPTERGPGMLPAPLSRKASYGR
ncbi:hypothetical protein BD324DRAFT_582277 [Kockovaella imperatae]|uniref:GRIP domain-containing protein n=1 Tax=Kockovaella imperatae TaxID=4999 RepID=A0A1Y1UBN0_9TREE|nr:hypothetical protein BD324DRAFT_582277 [Kockovaella imperatae]ORX35429.1 hypothetical protein BD324DRAFT_582277 [Kockovaella imperatae]